jgi:hypothetical protein
MSGKNHCKGCVHLSRDGNVCRYLSFVIKAHVIAECKRRKLKNTKLEVEPIARFADGTNRWGNFG